MYRFRLFYILLSMFLLYTSCIGNDEQAFDFSNRGFLITSNGDRRSAEAADYLYNHLLKRIREGGNFQIARSDDVALEHKEAIVYLEIVPDLGADYEIKNEENRLSIFGRDKETMVWLSYMLIDRIALFHHDIDVSDLPPGYITFQDAVGKFTMRYREPHFLPNTDLDHSGLLGTHSVDSDWGLWGHNLARVFIDGVEDSSYAWVNGKRDKQQFCFSASSTFKAIKNFIIDEYGDGRDVSKWFMIAPNDNKLVCTCSNCQAEGNTPKNATGSVVRLLNELATEFPKHYFFTTAYLTTAEAPDRPLESNTGVFISTIDLPKRPVLDKNDNPVHKFAILISDWKEKTNNIYLWDYISNFDDYLTPYPVLSRFKSNLSFFKAQGVNGMFLNGSGYDYSSLDDVKTYVMAALLHDASLSIAHLVEAYFKRFYPVTSDVLSSYYLTLEEQTASKNKTLPVYMSFREAEDLFFNQEQFRQLYEALDKVRPGLDREERRRIDKLLTAWSYTYLQVLYHRGYKTGGVFVDAGNDVEVSNKIYPALNRLKDHKKYTDLKRYKESGGELPAYIAEWEELLKTKPFSAKFVSDLQVIELNTTTILEEGKMLSDRMVGFASDFNQGWFMNSKDIEIIGTIGREIDSIEKVALRFLINKRHRMLPPVEVELLKEGVSLGKVSNKWYREQGNIVMVEFPVHMKPGDKLQIKIRQSKQITNSVIACDEIQLF